jgi:hypothetical protein
VKVEDCAAAATWVLEDGRPLWLVVSRDWEGQAPRCLQRLVRHHRPAEQRHFAGVDLWLFRPDNGMNEANRSTILPSTSIH